ncbi:MAG: copper amine oxidase N-terminal domain-containing protein, partial [Ruminococcaceae bacterium]|nr:copper amine oxidase N-terminal domain-containing protein [Oscillospiraceae bacterium]
MKKFLGILLAMLVLSMAAFAADITVTLNGEAIDFADQAPEIVEGRTLVPLRAIFEALGASVEWDQATKTVTSSMDDVTVKLTIGDNTLYRNGEGVTLDVAAQILNGRTMVPARAIAEAYGVDVQWDAATRTVVLTKEAQAKKDGVVK